MSRKDPYLEHLASIPLFADCTKAELQEIASVTTELRFRAGETLIEQGTLAHELLVIMSGSVVVHRNGQQVAVLGKGDVLGEMALLTQHPRSARAVVETDVEALVIDGRSFVPLLDDVHGLAKKLLFTVAARYGAQTT